MHKAVLISVLVVVCAVYCASASQEESTGVRSQQGAAAPQKKLRLLYGSVPSRGYRFRTGQSSSLDDDVLFGEEDPSVGQKRQYDDYGHMRFGKRNPKDFDDYGHLRFGK